jgi:hypothetical protein
LKNCCVPWGWQAQQQVPVEVHGQAASSMRLPTVQVKSGVAGVPSPYRVHTSKMSTVATSTLSLRAALPAASFYSCIAHAFMLCNKVAVHCAMSFCTAVTRVFSHLCDSNLSGATRACKVDLHGVRTRATWKACNLTLPVSTDLSPRLLFVVSALRYHARNATRRIPARCCCLA